MKLARRLLAKLRTGKALGGSPAVVERAEHIFSINYLNEGITVFDVGANCSGLSLLFVHFVGPSGHIHSFEAASSTFERLTAVCQASTHNNITLNKCVVADREGTMMLNIYDGEASGWNTLERV